ncbi:MAG: YsnF/AvaK domain-containing protein [Alphaproteobacteria bacterium]
MHGYNLVAIYPTLDEARRVSDRLLAEGISPADVRLTDAALTRGTSDVPHREGGFFDWLFASDVPDYDRDRYSAHLNEKHVAVSVRAADQHWHDRIIAIMEEFNPIDIEEDGHTVTHERHAAGTAAFGATSVPPAGTVARTDHTATVRTDLGTTARTDMHTTGTHTHARTGMSREREEVIPVVKEELDVGKRATERRYRVKSYVIEHPVEKQVMVRDERVEIEHRPISRTHTGDVRMPQERTIEVIERHEEPVVEKRMTADEEIVVRKEVVERPETVRGTVRETKVEVEKDPAATAARTTTNTTTDRTAGTTPRTPGATPRK